jgi:hypothetical protein
MKPANPDPRLDSLKNTPFSSFLQMPAIFALLELSTKNPDTASAAIKLAKPHHP